MPIKEKIKSHFTTYETSIDENGLEHRRPAPREKIINPLTLVRKLTLMNWVYFLMGWMAWTMDGYDFHTVSLSVSKLAVYYDTPRARISQSITLTLLFRSVGAAIFGIAGDLYGRKYPLFINMLIIAVLQVGTAYAHTFETFLAVRALFGIAMGGVWGLAASMSLENLPVECRGLFSGVLQQGYALGYLIASIFNLTIVPNCPHPFRALFYIGAALTALVGFLRLLFPESKQFLEAKAQGRQGGHAKASMREARVQVRVHWRRCVYAVVLMAGFNFMSHSSQDMYPTYMQQGKGFSAKNATLATLLGKVGAIIGGTIGGYYSQFFGRRLTIMVLCSIGACFIPLWVVPDSLVPLIIGNFMIDFCVQGAWGVIPVHLAELSPPAFRAAFPGITYQLGNMISSPAAQILSSVAESLKRPTALSNGTIVERPDYATTQAIMMAIIFVWVGVWAAIGKEERGSRFEEARAAGMGEVEREEKGRGVVVLEGEGRGGGVEYVEDVEAQRR
ncbi:MFS general substrate transporter [Saitoella complicata NRRL Y-17804]|uniref:MFS general substrate transporter n=1 Tax=Saitoella complicata (strain BCRC 22490 / CBS 7301 / JCM 7358 / NBRC 10748 / NRRL Y-17804) TaxID=698492 RepID=UPI000866EC1E|nr:MFS general substrate transporter [Saitoella complicata NRRL Y-17804]ODQ51814.1 MFS general substrate transporter [Saitoella complicata NRRL Y-17804]